MTLAPEGDSPVAPDTPQVVKVGSLFVMPRRDHVRGDALDVTRKGTLRSAAETVAVNVAVAPIGWLIMLAAVLFARSFGMLAVEGAIVAASLTGAYIAHRFRAGIARMFWLGVAIMQATEIGVHLFLPGGGGRSLHTGTVQTGMLIAAVIGVVVGSITRRE